LGGGPNSGSSNEIWTGGLTCNNENPQDD